jgi:hypothetical protein
LKNFLSINNGIKSQKALKQNMATHTQKEQVTYLVKYGQYDFDFPDDYPIIKKELKFEEEHKTNDLIEAVKFFESTAHNYLDNHYVELYEVMPLGEQSSVCKLLKSSSIDDKFELEDYWGASSGYILVFSATDKVMEVSDGFGFDEWGSFGNYTDIRHLQKNDKWYDEE